MHAFYSVFVVAKWIDINNIHRLIESRLVNPGACRRPQSFVGGRLGSKMVSKVICKCLNFTNFPGRNSPRSPSYRSYALEYGPAVCPPNQE